MKRIQRILLCLFLLVGGCATDDLFDYAPQRSYKFQTKNGVVVVRDDNNIDYLKVSADDLDCQELYAFSEEETIQTIFTNDKSDLSDIFYVQSYPTDARNPDAVPRITVIDAKDASTEVYDTKSIFAQHEFSADGKKLVLYHSNADIEQIGLYNPNEIAVIDLEAPPSATNPSVFASDLQGYQINRIFFLEPLMVNGIQRQFTAFVADGLVQFVDFNNAYASHTIRLKNIGEDNRVVTLSDIKVQPAYKHHNPRIFGMSPDTTEIFKMEIISDENGANFNISVSMLDSGAQPSAFEIVTDDEKMTLVAAANRRIYLYDIETEASHPIDVADHLYNISKSTDGQTLAMWGTGAYNIYYLSTADLMKNLGDNMDTVTVPNGIGSALLLDETHMLFTPINNSNTLSIVDLENRSISNLASQFNINIAGQQMSDDYIFINNQRTVSYLNLLTDSTSNVELDAEANAFYVFDGAGVAVALHDTVTGTATMIPTNAPTRDAAYVIDGFFVDDVLEIEKGAK